MSRERARVSVGRGKSERWRRRTDRGRGLASSRVDAVGTRSESTVDGSELIEIGAWRRVSKARPSQARLWSKDKAEEGGPPARRWSSSWRDLGSSDDINKRSKDAVEGEETNGSVGEGVLPLSLSVTNASLSPSASLSSKCGLDVPSAFGRKKWWPLGAKAPDWKGWGKPTNERKKEGRKERAEGR